MLRFNMSWKLIYIRTAPPSQITLNVIVLNMWVWISIKGNLLKCQMSLSPFHMENKATRLKQIVLLDSSFTQMATALTGGTAFFLIASLKIPPLYKGEKTSQGHCQDLKNADAWLFIPFPFSTFILLGERKAEGLAWLEKGGGNMAVTVQTKTSPSQLRHCMGQPILIISAHNPNTMKRFPVAETGRCLDTLRNALWQ